VTVPDADHRSPTAEYDARLADRRSRIAALDRQHLLFSNARLAVACVGAVLLWMAFIRAVLSPVWPLLVWLVFGALAVAHARLLNRMDRAKNAERWYLRGLDRLTGQWPGTGRDGTPFLRGHSYGHDLDLFGRASLFELMNTARTGAGESMLADWLRSGSAVGEILARQAAVAELKPMLDFREEVAVFADESSIGRTGPLGAWAASPSAGFPPALGTLLAALAAATAVLAGAVAGEWVGLIWFLAWASGIAIVQAIWRRRFDRALHAVETPERDLALVCALITRIEAERFESPRLTALRAAFGADGALASRRIAQLRRLVSWVDATHNMMFAPIAYLLLVKPQLAVAIDRWHTRHGAAVGEWLRAIGETEALAALATYAFEHPSDPFPELTADGPVFDSEALGHPLIADDRSVRNDVRLGGSGGPRVILVSGSNMSGKSTLLRSVGLNTVLALAGAPVRARRLRLSPLLLGATLRIDDSLPAGHSRFYAEILRLREIVDAARGPVPLLYLLDEILHGTNSHDRRIGAEGIVTALVRLGAIGLVTTHDLALTELPNALGPAAANWHFEDTLENGRMVFDYTMRPGIVTNSNALALMRAVGLDV
jgi:MutS domain V